jgi:hypothetical protein
MRQTFSKNNNTTTPGTKKGIGPTVQELSGAQFICKPLRHENKRSQKTPIQLLQEPKRYWTNCTRAFWGAIHLHTKDERINVNDSFRH